MPAPRSSPVLLFLIIIAGFVLGYLYQSQTDAAADIVPIDTKLQAASLKGLENLSINYSFIESSAFTDLKVFGELPVPSVADGNHNPFQ